MEKAILQLQTPATPEHAANVRLFLAESSRHFQVPEESATDLIIAATEVFALVAGATQSKGATPKFSLEVDSSPNEMHVSISAGNGFDYSLEPGTEMPGISGPAIIEALFPGTRPDASGVIRLSVPIGSG